MVWMLNVALVNGTMHVKLLNWIYLDEHILYFIIIIVVVDGKGNMFVSLFTMYATFIFVSMF